MKNKNFLKILSCFGIVFALMMIGNQRSFAQKDYPNRDIELVVPFIAGGMVDVATRIIHEDLSKILGVPIVIVNKPGAGGTIGAHYVSQAKPDGYTIMGGPHSLFIIAPAIYPNIPYRTLDFVPIARIVNTPFLFAVRKEAPWKTLEEIISYAKKNPGKLSCATAGVGTGSHFMLEMLKLEAGIEIQHVPFKGGSQQNAALLGGHVDLDATTLNPLVPLVRSGDARIIVTTYKMKEFPGVPTLAEKGYPEATIGAWVGYVAPKGVEKSIIDKLSIAFEKAIRNPKAVKSLEETGSDIDFVAKEKVAQEIERESKKMAEVVKKAKIVVQ